MDVLCIASCPSLTAADCERYRASFNIAVNTSYAIAPWADAVFAMDLAWWDIYAALVPKTMVRYSSHRGAIKKHGLTKAGPFKGTNSGHQAIELAVSLGASRITLLGYDMQLDGDRAHWHGNHPSLGNPKPCRFGNWIMDFEILARQVRIPIVNATRKTALTCFPACAP
jgi:hypothetical protein